MTIKELLAEMAPEIAIMNTDELPYATPEDLLEWLEQDLPVPMPCYLAPLVIYEEDEMPAPSILIFDAAGVESPWIFAKGSYEAGMPPNCGQLYVNKTGQEDGWEIIGGKITSSPNVAQMDDGTVVVAARGEAGDIVIISMDLEGNWGEWKSIGGRT